MEKFNYSKIIKETKYGKVRLLKNSEYEDMPESMKNFCATDFALLCGCSVTPYGDSEVRPQNIKLIDNMNAEAFARFRMVNPNNCLEFREIDAFAGIAPVVEIDISKRSNNSSETRVLEVKKEILSSIKHEKVDNEDVPYLEMGTYPQSFVGRDLSDKLEELYNRADPQLKATGRTYVTNSNFNYYDTVISKAFHPEFEYNGERYVRTLNRQYQSVVFEGERTARILYCMPAWVKVEPIKFYIYNWDNLPKSINPNGKGKDKTIKLVSAKSLVSSFPNLIDYNSFRQNLNDEAIYEKGFVRGFLNGEKYIPNDDYFLYEENAFCFKQTGGFLGEAFDLDKTFSKTLVIDDTQNMIRDYDLCGCVYFDTIKFAYKNKIPKIVFNGTQMKYAYYLNDDFYATKDKPDKERIQDGSSFVNISNFFNSFSDVSVLHKEFLDIPLIGEVSDLLAKHNLSFPIYFFANMSPQKIDDFVHNANLNFALDMIREIERKGNFSTASDGGNLFRFLNALGCFSNKYIVDKNGKETNVLFAQKACSFAPKLIFNDDNNLSFISSYISGNFYPEPNQNFLKFISVKDSEGKFENFDLIRTIGKNAEDTLEGVMEHFDEVKLYRKGINEEGMPFTRPWRTAICMYLLGGEYHGITEDNKDIADLFASFGLSQSVFNDALFLRNSAIKHEVPHHILSTPLKEETILETIERIKNQTEKELDNSSTNVIDAYSKMFTFEFLDKYDPKNFIIGLFVDCCCTISGRFYGGNIAKKSVTSSKVQNLVIRNANNEIVGKATMYVGSDFAVFNEFDIAEKYRNDYNARQKALSAFLRGTKEFIKQYDLEHPDTPIQIFTVGMGYNKLAEELRKFETAKGQDKIYISPHYRFEDAEDEQRILYKKDEIDINDYLEEDDSLNN